MEVGRHDVTSGDCNRSASTEAATTAASATNKANDEFDESQSNRSSLKSCEHSLIQGHSFPHHVLENVTEDNEDDESEFGFQNLKK